MEKRESCEKCGKLIAPYESVNLGSIEEGYQLLCFACTNAEIAEHAGVKFKHPEYLPMKLTDIESNEHEFHFNTHLLGDRIAITALEIKNGEPRGYEFEVIGDDPEEDTLDLFRRLFDRMQRSLSQRHLRVDEHGIYIDKPDVVRARIECDLENPDGMPLLVVDGKEIAWNDFGHMLMSFEGFQFKMEIYEISEER
jgi:hypothetical protein